jgi:hypothetical protein
MTHTDYTNHLHEKGIEVNHHERSTEIPSRRIGRFFATHRVHLGAGGSGAPSVPLLGRTVAVRLTSESTRVRRHLPIIILSAALVLAFVFARPVLAAESVGLPRLAQFHVGSGDHESPYATRAELSANLNVSGSETIWRIEYATKKIGPWVLAGSGSRQVGGSGAEIIATAYHLTPETTYYARVVAENAHGSATEEIQFKTLAIGPPEFLEKNCGELTGDGAGGCLEALGVTSATVYAEVDTDGAEAEYHWEYSTSPSGPWIPVSGASGHVSVAEDFTRATVHLTGLAAETHYYVRLVATNSIGMTSEIGEFKTRPAHPTDSTGSVTELTATSTHFAGVVDPDESETHWRFEYAPAEGGPWAAVPGAEGTIPQAKADDEYHQVAGELTGLSPAHIYYVRLFAQNEHGSETASDVGFETAGSPIAQALAVHVLGVGGSVSVFGAVGAHGADTHYHFEYSTQEQFAHSGFAEASDAPEGDIEAGGTESKGGITGFFSSATVSADLAGLQPGKTYHYRIVANNEAAPGGVPSDEQTLTVPAASPETEEEEPCSNQATRTGLSAHLPDCRAYEQVTPVDKEGAKEFFKNGGGANTSTLVGTEGEDFMIAQVTTHWGAGPDAGDSPYFFARGPEGWQMTAGSPQPETGVDTYVSQVFAADLTSVGLEAGWATGGGISTEMEFKAGPAGGPYTVAAKMPRSQVGADGGWVAASASAAKLILAVEDRSLIPAHPSTTASGQDLYEYSGGELRQANVTGGSPGRTIGTCGATVVDGRDYVGTESETNHLSEEGASDAAKPHAVSANGARVFFEAVPGNNCSEPADLYIRVDGAETVDLGPYALRASDPEATQLLLEKASGTTQEFFLYHTESASLQHLFNTNEGGNLGRSVHVSEDFKAIYLESKEQLPGTKAPAGGGIYSYDIATQTLRFLTPAGRANSSAIDWLSPDGRYVDFFAVQLGIEKGAEYRYDSTDGAAVCISCASTFDPQPQKSLEFERTSADGNFAFFTTVDALVPQDVNGEVETVYNNGQDLHEYEEFTPSEDVYEWRAEGVDGCRRLEGCIRLISSGTAFDTLVRFLGTDPSGRDVFFATHAQLLPSDDDSALDVYDARIGGGFPPPPPRPVECEGDACSTPFAAPTDLSPSSSSFHGAGDVTAPAVTSTNTKGTTKKPKKKQHTVKTVKKKRRGRHVKAKRAVHHRRGGAK